MNVIPIERRLQDFTRNSRVDIAKYISLALLLYWNDNCSHSKYIIAEVYLSDHSHKHRRERDSRDESSTLVSEESERLVARVIRVTHFLYALR